VNENMKCFGNRRLLFSLRRPVALFVCGLSCSHGQTKASDRVSKTWSDVSSDHVFTELEEEKY